MCSSARTIHVPNDSELARLLEEADGTPLRLEKDGVTYRVSREKDDLWAHYDSEAACTGMAAVAGHLTPEEAETLKAYLSQGRKEGSRPLGHP